MSRRREESPKPYGYRSVHNTVRCGGYTSAGRRCKRKTTKTPLCYQHLAKEDGLMIKKSQIPHAGMGLYTIKPRRLNENITKYAATNTDYTDEDESQGHLKAGEYVLQIKDKYFNPYKTTDSAGRFSNNARRANHLANNSGIGYSSTYHRPFLKAMKTIPNASKEHPRELLSQYGRSYWK